MTRKREKNINPSIKRNKRDGSNHTLNDVGLPEDIRVVHSGEPNPHDGQ